MTLTSKASAAEATPTTLHGAGQPWTLAKQLLCPLALHPGNSLHHPRKPRSGGISHPPARTRDLVRPPVSRIWSKAQPPDKECVHKFTRNNPWAPYQPACCPCPPPPPNHCPRSQGLWGRPLGPSPSGVGKLQAGAAARGRAPSHTSCRAPVGTLLTELRAAPKRCGLGSRDEGRAGPLARRAEGSDSKTQTKHHQTAGRGESARADGKRELGPRAQLVLTFSGRPLCSQLGLGVTNSLPPICPPCSAQQPSFLGSPPCPGRTWPPAGSQRRGHRGALRGYEPSALPRGPDLAQKAPCRQPLLKWSRANASQPHSLHRPRAHRQRGGRHGSGRRHPLQVQT